MFRNMKIITAAVAVALLAVAAACTQSDPPGSGKAAALAQESAASMDAMDHAADIDQPATDTIAVHDHGPAVPEQETTGLAGHIGGEGTMELVALPGGDQPPVVVNVWFDNRGVWPQQVSVPAGRQVQLVMRNHDQEEHHYHIMGLPTVGMLWLSKEGEMSTESDVTAEDHEIHHAAVNMVPFHICTSRSGVCPTGQWIHAHAEPADMDIIVFVTDEPGTYEVSDPLHPDLKAMVNVF